MWKIAFILLFQSSTLFAEEWGYAKDDDWSDLDGECDGKFQSPIDLVDYCDVKDNKTVILDRSLAIVFINYDKKLKGNQLMMKNNGHTAQINLRGSEELDNSLPQLSGSALGFNKFQLQQIHFHWNRNGSHAGSEHSLYGHKHAFEMHLVHFNTKYDAPDDANDHPDGSAVLSVLFDYHDCEEENKSKKDCDEKTPENHALAPITKKIRDVDDAEESTRLGEDLNLRQLLPRDTNTFFWYQGSLTTPPCLEDLTWIVFPEIQNISKRQLESFELNFKNEDGKILGTTNREVQPLNGRLLLISRDEHCHGKDASSSGESDNFAESTDISIGAQQTVGGDDDDDDEDDNNNDDNNNDDNNNDDNNSDDDNNNDDNNNDDNNNDDNNNDDNNNDNKGSKDKGSKDDESKGKGSKDGDGGSENNSNSSSDNSSSGNSTGSSDSESSDKSKGSSDQKNSSDKKSSSSSSSSSGGGSDESGKKEESDDDKNNKDKDGDDKEDNSSSGNKNTSGSSSGGGGKSNSSSSGSTGKSKQSQDSRSTKSSRSKRQYSRNSPPKSKDNGGVLSNAAGVDRPYGLYGNKPNGR